MPPKPFRFYLSCLLPTLLLPALLIPAVVNADELRITPYLGYRVGGEFNDFATGTTLKLDEGESYGFIVSKGDDSDLEFLYSLQPSKLNARGPVTSTQLFDVDVTNIMVAGKNVLDKDVGTFVSGMVGVTHFDPHKAGLSSDTRFALGASGGIDYRISKRLDLRLEGRAIATFLDTDGGVFCSSSGGCSVFADADVLFQFEFVTGFTFKF